MTKKQFVDLFLSLFLSRFLLKHKHTMTDNDDEQIYGKRYRVVKKLGAGNFGTAYLVTDLKARNEP